MSGYSPTPGSNYPSSFSQIHPNLHPHSPGQNAVGGETAHSLSQRQAYPYDPQPSTQLQFPYSNEQTNGNNGNFSRPDQSQQSAPVSTSAPAAGSGGQPQAQKQHRLRKACDSCSKRKVKCDEEKPSCKGCNELKIPCTFERPTKRRGPPNKIADQVREEIRKRQQMESNGGGSLGYSSPTSPSGIAAASAALASFSSQLNAESICAFSTLELFVDDFFTYIHPLCPFPHEPSFRYSFKSREDLHNPSFLALLASMIGALVASFPRKPLLHLKAQHREHLFTNSLSLVNRCHKIAVEARGPGYLDKDLDIHDAVTSYFLALTGAYTFQHQQARLYMAETLAITRSVLVSEKAKTQGVLSAGSYGTQSQNFFENQMPHVPVDYIRQEVGRRVFWVIFVSLRSMQQYDSRVDELFMPPSTPNMSYPPLPLEVDDEYIYVDHIDPQPAGVISKLVGYNLNIKIYSTITPLATMELAYGVGKLFDWNKQQRLLEECLQSVKQVLDTAPREFLLQTDSRAPHLGPLNHQQYYPPTADHPGYRTNGSEAQWLNSSSEARRHLQFEIQKANVYASQLGTRSYIVEKYLSLQEVYEKLKVKPNDARSPTSQGIIDSALDETIAKPSGNTDELMVNERERIVKDLLLMLSSIDQVNMEPNSSSFHNKIRQIALTLLDTPQNRKGPFAVRNEEYLGKFLEVLVKLENFSQQGGEGNGADEDEDLRNWANLREYQMRFAQAGGFLGQQ